MSVTLDVDINFVMENSGKLVKPANVLHNVQLHVSATSDEYDLLQRAHACSKEILNYVNQAVRDCENHQKLVNFQRRLDKRSIENSTHPVILEYKVKPAPSPSPSTSTHPVILEYKVKPAPSPSCSMRIPLRESE